MGAMSAGGWYETQWEGSRKPKSGSRWPWRREMERSLVVAEGNSNPCDASSVTASFPAGIDGD
jgi:hypothetical protein